MSVSAFYALFRTPGAALAKFDPLPNEPLLQLLDPRTPRRPVTPVGRVRWWRLLTLWLLMTVPTLILAQVQPEHGFDRLGSGIRGDKGLLSDIDLYSMWIIWACYLVLIVLSRRLIGSLLITLERVDVVAPRAQGMWTLAPRNRYLRFLEWISRVNPARVVGWALLLLVLNVVGNQLGTMGDSVQTWRTDPLTSGTFWAFFHRGTEQMNLAGFWHVGLASALGGYLVLLLCRLYVVFACMSEVVAGDPTLRVSPTHPDSTGGLMPIGRAALFMALGVFVSGLGLTAIAVQSYLTHSPLNAVFVLLVVLYLILGPVLFFLPLAPLRRAMIDAKQRYLLEADHLYQAAETQHREDVLGLKVDANALQGHSALAHLIERAGDMTVWPFDRKTFRRFLGLLVTPILPLLKEIPIVAELIRAILGIE